MNDELRAVVFDMDATLAALYDVEDWLPKLRNEDPSPYEEAEPMVDFEKLYSILAWLKSYGVKVVVTSWLSKGATPEYKKAIREAKREWLKRYDFPYDEIHLISYGASKSRATKHIGGEQILVDDSPEVRAEWKWGRTIDATQDICNALLNVVLQLVEDSL